jgi:hypothetical protein
VVMLSAKPQPSVSSSTADRRAIAPTLAAESAASLTPHHDRRARNHPSLRRTAYVFGVDTPPPGGLAVGLCASFGRLPPVRGRRPFSSGLGIQGAISGGSRFGTLGRIRRGKLPTPPPPVGGCRSQFHVLWPSGLARLRRGPRSARRVPPRWAQGRHIRRRRRSGNQMVRIRNVDNAALALLLYPREAKDVACPSTRSPVGTTSRWKSGFHCAIPTQRSSAARTSSGR